MMTIRQFKLFKWTFTRLIDTNASIPGGAGKFLAFGSPSMSGRNVAFVGKGANDQVGIYKIVNGRLERVVDKGMAIPAQGTGSPGNFSDFGRPDISGEWVAFCGGGLPGTGHAGVYVDRNRPSPAVVADTETLIPPNGGTQATKFTAFSKYVAIADDSVAFFGENPRSAECGIFRADWNPSTEKYLLSVVASQGTPVPEGVATPRPAQGMTFSGFGQNPALSQRIVVFSGRSKDNSADNNFKGIYANIDGTNVSVVDENVGDPNGIGNFADFGDAAIAEGTVVFEGWDAQGRDAIHNIDLFPSPANGVYPVGILASQSSPVPNGTGNFTILNRPSTSNGNAAFYGYDTFSRLGIFAVVHVPGVLTFLSRVVGPGDTIDGKSVYCVNDPPNFVRPALSGSSIAISLRFADQSAGIYRADYVPVLTAWQKAVEQLKRWGDVPVVRRRSRSSSKRTKTKR